MSRSRVQTRISLRRLLAGEAVSEAGAEGEAAEAGTEEITGPGFSGGVEAPHCFWSERSILGALLFIARASRPAPHAIFRFAQRAPDPGEPCFSYDSCRFRGVAWLREARLGQPHLGGNPGVRVERYDS